MVSAASTAAMDLMQVIPVLLSGIAQEVGLEPTELKLVLVADEGQYDPKPFQTLVETYDKLEWLGVCSLRSSAEPSLIWKSG